MLKLYNTLTKKKETFKPAKKSQVSLYTCGPTVYDAAHIGNLRTYVFEDLLRRSLKYLGYSVKQVMNITDIEDKIIDKAKKQKKDIKEVTKSYTKLFFKDLAKLNIEPAEKYPLATAHIKEMISLIKKLIDKGYAYVGKDKSVYFDISKFKKYGELVGIKNIKIKDGARVSADEYDKDEARDFVLWKAKKQGEPSWKSPWGDGRPGWHIECSAMAMHHLGETIDIHTGGVDNIFPHHDNEIAQSEAATGKKFVKYWLHGEHLLVDEEKMSKSKKNFFTLKDIEKKGRMPLSFRYLVAEAHYKTKLNFTWRALEGAENAIWNLWHELGRLKFIGSKDEFKDNKKLFNKYLKDVKDTVSEDLNIPGVLALMRRGMTDPDLSPKQRREVAFEFDKILGFNLKHADKLYRVPIHITTLATGRELLRRNQQFVKADSLRRKIESLGYSIEDTSYGPFLWPSKQQKFHPKI